MFNSIDPDALQGSFVAGVPVLYFFLLYVTKH